MKSHIEVIDALGGGGKLAVLLSEHLHRAPHNLVGRNMVYQWRSKDRIPALWHLPIVQIAQAQGLSDITVESLRAALVDGPDGDSLAAAGE